MEGFLIIFTIVAIIAILIYLNFNKCFYYLVLRNKEINTSIKTTPKKDSSFINILQDAPSTLIVLDPTNELYLDIKKVLEDKGYDVKPNN